MRAAKGSSRLRMGSAVKPGRGRAVRSLRLVTPRDPQCDAAPRSAKGTKRRDADA